MALGGRIVPAIVLILLWAASADSRAAVELTGDGWHSWDVPAGSGGARACCHAWRGGTPASTGCSLDGDGRGRGFPGDCDTLSADLRIYVRLVDGQVREIRPLSAACPVSSRDPVRVESGISTAESIEWLLAIVRRSSRLADDAIMAISRHDDEMALAALRGLLEDQTLGMQIREQALFWMVQSGSDEAFAYLDDLLSTP